MCKGCLENYYDVSREQEADIAALPEVAAMSRRIEEFYRMDPEHTDMGGPIHVVVYDTNVEDHHLLDVYRPEDHGYPPYPVAVVDAALGILADLRRMTMAHRAVACAYAEVP